MPAVITGGFGSFGSISSVILDGYDQEAGAAPGESFSDTAYSDSAYSRSAFSFGVGEGTPSGGGGIDPPRRIVKPTGLTDRKPRKDVQARVDDTREIHAEIAAKLAKELRDGIEPPIVGMSLSEIDREIGELLREVQRTEEEDIRRLLMLAMLSIL